MSDIIEAMAAAIYGAAERPQDIVPDQPYEPGMNVKLDFSHLVRAALAAAEAQGYVLVPKEPTEAQVEAGRKAMSPEKFVSHARSMWVYSDMLAAAPKVTP